MRRVRTGLAGGVLGGLLLAWAPACAPSDADKTRAARDVVGRFFTALPSGDCAVLGPLLVDPAPEACRATVDDLLAHGVSLVEVLEVSADGRVPDAVLVRTRVARDGRVREQPLLLRVQRRGDGWRLHL